MGLRERNAAQTRELILDSALELFLDRGYEATTMEAIAEQAQVGISTLYRYFPSKDLLITEPLAIRGHMAEALQARPADESLEVALGHAITALLIAPRVDRVRLRQIQAVLATAPAPRLRMLDDFMNERRLLEHAVAERLGRPAGDTFAVATARLATIVLELVTERTHDVDLEAEVAEQQIRAIAGEVMQELAAEAPVLPQVAS